MFPIMKVSLLFGLLTVSLVKHTESLNLISWLKTTMGATISFTQFVVHGKRHFTRTGYEKHLSYYTDPVQSAATETTDGVSMEGRVVVVTG
jgi:cell shape-determining protein MreC